MSFGDGETKESDGDGDFGNGADPDVAGLAEPPPLERVSCSSV